MKVFKATRSVPSTTHSAPREQSSEQGSSSESDPQTVEPEIRKCSTCGVEKPLDEYYFRPDRGQHNRQCKRCKLDAVKQWGKRNPEAVRSYKRKYQSKVNRDPALRARQAENSRRYRERLKEREADYQRYLEDSRIRMRLMRERQKGELLPPTSVRAPFYDPDPHFPVGPMRKWLRERYPAAHMLADRVGLDESTIRRIRDEPNKKFVRRSIVDKILTREGSTLMSELYPGT